MKPEEWRINNQWKLRLDSALSQSTTPGTRGGPGVRQATTSRSGDVAVEWWLIPGGIQLHAGNSLHGQYIEFYPRADSLVGRTYDYADTRNGFTTDPLSAHRTACPS